MGPLGVSGADIGLINNTIVNNIAVTIFSKEVYQAAPPLAGPLSISNTDIGLISNTIVNNIVVAIFSKEVY